MLQVHLLLRLLEVEGFVSHLEFFRGVTKETKNFLRSVVVKLDNSATVSATKTAKSAGHFYLALETTNFTTGGHEKSGGALNFTKVAVKPDRRRHDG